MFRRGCTYLYNSADFERQVCVFVLLPHLETRKVREPELHLVLIQEVLGNCAFHCLAVFQLKGQNLNL